MFWKLRLGYRVGYWLRVFGLQNTRPDTALPLGNMFLEVQYKKQIPLLTTYNNLLWDRQSTDTYHRVSMNWVTDPWTQCAICPWPPWIDPGRVTRIWGHSSVAWNRCLVTLVPDVGRQIRHVLSSFSCLQEDYRVQCMSTIQGTQGHVHNVICWHR